MSMIFPDEDCIFDKKTVRISESALVHMRYYKIMPNTLCDMISSPIECPKQKKTGKPFRRTSKRICSSRKDRIYNIILDPLEINGKQVWSVSHLEPI